MALCLALAGCASSSSGSDGAQPAPLMHLVYIQLLDPGDLDELRADCVRLLTGIPGVHDLALGTHFESGRETVDSDYDLLLFMRFDDGDDYRAYVEHADHVALVDKWRARFRSLTVSDAWADSLGAR